MTEKETSKWPFGQEPIVDKIFSRSELFNRTVISRVWAAEITLEAIKTTREQEREKWIRRIRNNEEVLTGIEQAKEAAEQRGYEKAKSEFNAIEWSKEEGYKEGYEKGKKEQPSFTECIACGKKQAVHCIDCGLDAIAKEREKKFGEYLSEEEKKTLGDLKFPQYALGLQSCKTIGEVVSILQEIEKEAEQRGREQEREKWIRCIRNNEEILPTDTGIEQAKEAAEQRGYEKAKSEFNAIEWSKEEGYKEGYEKGKKETAKKIFEKIEERIACYEGQIDACNDNNVSQGNIEILDWKIKTLSEFEEIYKQKWVKKE